MNQQTRQNLLRFFGYTVAFSWFFWLPGVLDYFGIVSIPEGLLKLLMVVGALGPATSALILTHREEGKAGVKLMLNSAFNVKQHWHFWLGAIGLILAVHAIARVMFALVTDDLPVSTLLESPAGIIPMFICHIFCGRWSVRRNWLAWLCPGSLAAAV